MKSDGHLIRGDGIGYFMHVRSVVIDGDLDFTNERAHYAGRLELWSPPRDGRLPNKFASVGMLLLWLPFYLVAHGLALAGEALGLGTGSDGYGLIYEVAVCTGSIAYGAIGLALAHRFARDLYGDRAATWAAATFALASPYVFYLVVMPYMSHMNSLFAVSAMLFVWLARLRGGTGRMRDFAALGAAAGLTLTVRTQDALFLLIPFGGIAFAIAASARRGDRRLALRFLAGGALAAAVAAAIFALQLHTWHSMFGSIRSPAEQDLGPRTFHWADPQLWGVLFSTRHGLFSWHPVLLAATAGLALHARRDRSFALACLAIIAGEVYVVASWWAWHQGDAFGGRMFLDCGFAWVIGLAAVFAAQPTAARLAAAHVAAGLLIVWNALALVQYTLGYVSRGAALSVREMTVDRLLLPVTIVEKWRAGR